jgi:hypothetical protein
MLRLVATLAVAGGAGALAQALRCPLPWMIGPLLCSALLCMAGAPLLGSDRLRNAGQWIIGSALGLYFTPAVLGTVWRLAPAVAGGALWALALGYGFYRFLWWSHQGSGVLNRSTAFFAAAIGGASEMAILAERAGAQIDRVAAAHSLRVLLVVVIVPFTLQALGVHGIDLALPGARDVHWPALALLLAASAGGGLSMRRLGAPNPWVLGALGVSALLAGTELAGTAMPRAFSNAAQVVIGISLGTRFSPEFLRRAPRWLAAVAGGTLAMLAVSAVFGAMLAAWLGGHPATLVLATVPGGIAEAAITASVLGLGVPVVTAFQVVRYVTVLTLTGVLYRWEQLHRQSAD